MPENRVSPDEVVEGGAEALCGRADCLQKSSCMWLEVSPLPPQAVFEHTVADWSLYYQLSNAN